MDHSVIHDFIEILWILEFSIFVHQVGDEFLVERAPINSNADGLAIFNCDLNDTRKILIAAVPFADITWIDPVFREGLRAFRVFFK